MNFKFYIPIVILFIFLFSAPVPAQDADLQREIRYLFGGIWTRETGSVFKFEDGKMICTKVTSNKTGWIGKSALEKFRKIDGQWYADAAIRFGHTGDLYEWIKVKLQVKKNILYVHYPPNKYGADVMELKRVD